MEWKPIEEYDRLKKKPLFAVFRFEPVLTKAKHTCLPMYFCMDRHFGSRVCTHWIELPEFKES